MLGLKHGQIALFLEHNYVILVQWLTLQFHRHWHLCSGPKYRGIFVADCFLACERCWAGPLPRSFERRLPFAAQRLHQREEHSSTRGGFIKDNANGPAQFAGSCFLFFGWLVIFSLKKPTVVFSELNI